MQIQLFRTIAAVLFITAGSLYGGFWMIVAMVNATPDYTTDRRLNMATLGLICIGCSFWAASFVLRAAPVDKNK